MSHDGDAADALLLARGEHARLLAKYEPIILGRCVAELRGHLDADDVAQDVKVRLWRELHQGQVLRRAFPGGRPQGHRLDGRGLLRRAARRTFRCQRAGIRPTRSTASDELLDRDAVASILDGLDDGTTKRVMELRYLERWTSTRSPSGSGWSGTPSTRPCTAAIASSGRL